MTGCITVRYNQGDLRQEKDYIDIVFTFSLSGVVSHAELSKVASFIKASLICVKELIILRNCQFLGSNHAYSQAKCVVHHKGS